MHSYYLPSSEVDKKICDYASKPNNDHQVRFSLKGIRLKKICILQSLSFDLSSLSEFPLLNNQTMKTTSKLSISRKLPKSSWRKIDLQYSFHVIILFLMLYSCKYIHSLGHLSSYWIKEKDGCV